VDVQAADALPPCRDSRVVDELRVPRLIDDLLVLRAAERMGSGGGDLQSRPMTSRASPGVSQTPEFSSRAEAKSSLLKSPGNSRFSLAAISSFALGERASVSASSTISSSSTPTDQGLLSPKCASIGTKQG